MKLYQMNPKEDNMISLVTTQPTFPGSHKANTDKVLISLSPLILMTFLRILTSTASTGMPATGDTSRNTSGPTRNLTAVTRDTFKEVSEQVFLRTYSTRQRECLPLRDTPNRLTTDFTVHQNNTVEQ